MATAPPASTTRSRAVGAAEAPRRIAILAHGAGWAMTMNRGDVG